MDVVSVDWSHPFQEFPVMIFGLMLLTPLIGAQDRMHRTQGIPSTATSKKDIEEGEVV
jgi:hypothetical protein